MSPDPLLYLLSEALSASLDDNNNNNSNNNNNNNNNNENCTNKSMENQNQVEVMTLELARYKNLLANMAASSMGEDSTSITNSNANNKVVSAGAGAGDINDNNDEDKKPNDDYYFDGYSSLTIHVIMLRDSPRTTTYGAAMLEKTKEIF
jgi:hypothetical protein